MARASVRLYVNKSVIVKANDPTSRVAVDKNAKYYLEADSPGTPYGVFMLLGFDQFPAELKNQRLYEINGKFCIYWGAMMITPLKETFDPETVTWETKPDIVLKDDSRDIYYISAGKSTDPESPGDSPASFNIVNTDLKSENARAFLLASAAQARASSTQYALYVREMLVAGTEPYIDVYYDDAVAVQSQIEQNNSPIDGYFNPRESISFQWGYISADDQYVCAGDFTQASAKLCWKASGEENYHEISVSGDQRSYTAPANTFTTGTTIEWYLEGTDTAGTTSRTETYSFSTTAGAATATLKKPINSVEDGTAPIRIEWSLSSTDGQEPIAVDLWWKTTDASTWTALLNHAAAVSSYTAPAGTFPSGEIQLIVRAYNVDDVAGAWSRPSSSSYYSFICAAAPDPVQGLQATSSPRTTIRWQSRGQQGYEITIDGKVVTSEYGPDVTSWQAQTPLSDGVHTISVRIQGMYSLWSQPTTISVQITNSTPQEWTEVQLAGTFETDAVLTLTNTGQDFSGTNVYWYRDGKNIAWTIGQTYHTDRFVLGEHTYYAELVDDDGNYKRTNTISGTMKTEGVVIAPLSGGEWLNLKLSENEESIQTFQYGRTAKLQQILGAKYPVLELSEFETLKGTYDCAFETIADAAPLEAMKGQAVIIKSKGNQILIGAILSLQRTIRRHYVSYTFSVEQIDWEDFVRYDAGN